MRRKGGTSQPDFRFERRTENVHRLDGTSYSVSSSFFYPNHLPTYRILSSSSTSVTVTGFVSRENRIFKFLTFLPAGFLWNLFFWFLKVLITRKPLLLHLHFHMREMCKVTGSKVLIERTVWKQIQSCSGKVVGAGFFTFSWYFVMMNVLRVHSCIQS